MEKGPFEFGGPYFIACNHGCFHGNNTHGIDAYSIFKRSLAYNKEHGVAKNRLFQQSLEHLRSKYGVGGYAKQAS